MKLITSGDLSAEKLEVRSNDEIGQLTGATNEMNETMRELLNEIAEVSETVGSQSEQLTQSANEVSEGAEQIILTMQALANASETEAHSVSEMSSVMSDFAMRVQEANESGENIQQSSNEVLQMTEEGSQLMGSSTKQMKLIDK